MRPHSRRLVVALALLAVLTGCASPITGAATIATGSGSATQTHINTGGQTIMAVTIESGAPPP